MKWNRYFIKETLFRQTVDGGMVHIFTSCAWIHLTLSNLYSSPFDFEKSSQMCLTFSPTAMHSYFLSLFLSIKGTMIEVHWTVTFHKAFNFFKKRAWDDIFKCCLFFPSESWHLLKDYDYSELNSSLNSWKYLNSIVSGNQREREREIQPRTDEIIREWLMGNIKKAAFTSYPLLNKKCFVPVQLFPKVI